MSELTSGGSGAVAGVAIARQPAAEPPQSPDQPKQSEQKTSNNVQEQVDSDKNWFKGQVKEETEQAINGKTDSRSVLEMLALKIKGERNQKLTSEQRKIKEAKAQKKIEAMTKKLKISKEPKQVALGYDFEIAVKQSDLADIQNEINYWKSLVLSEKDQDGTELKPERKQVFIKNIEDLEGKEAENKAPEGKKQMVEEEIKDLQSKKREDLEKISENQPQQNQAERLAEQMGLSKENPFGEIISKLSQVANMNKKDRKNFFKDLKEKGFSKKERKLFKKIILDITSEQSSGEKAIKIAGKASTYSLIGLILMMYMAKKKGEGGQR